MPSSKTFNGVSPKYQSVRSIVVINQFKDNCMMAFYAVSKIYFCPVLSFQLLAQLDTLGSQKTIALSSQTFEFTLSLARRRAGPFGTKYSISQSPESCLTVKKA